MSVWQPSQVISTMSPLEAVRCLSTEDVVEMITGLAPLNIVTVHAEQVSIYIKYYLKININFV